MTASRFVAYLVCVALGACVTVNVYFPAAAAEKAADRIINDVYGKPKKKKSTPKPQEEAPVPEQRSDPGKDGDETSAIDRVFDLVIPAAYAAKKPNLKISTPAIKLLRAAMKARYGQLAPHYQSGAIGIVRDGSLTVRDASRIPAGAHSQVAGWVADENADRKALYKEIAQANGHPEWVDEIQDTFAAAWVENAPPGFWYQDASGVWRQK
jgi:uncharacterized protein YdbL (DUF1318 family)